MRSENDKMNSGLKARATHGHCSYNGQHNTPRAVFPNIFGHKSIYWLYFNMINDLQLAKKAITDMLA